MKYMLGQNLKTFVIRILLFTFLMGFVYVFAENYAERTSFITCGWSFIANTWLDENGNQLWDEKEKPLPSVQVFVDFIQSINNSIFRVDNVGNEAFTDLSGMIEVHSFSSCDEDEIHEVYVKPPPGYKLTTSERIIVRTHTLDDIFLFGFKKE